MDQNGTRSPIADAQLDRLVDGVLPDSERKALLSRLEAEPDGWRRCALAFLQAQTWREALGPIARPEVGRDTPTIEHLHRSPRWPSPVPIALAAGLSFAAFLLGRTTAIERRPGGDPGAGVPIAASDVNASPSDEPIAMVPESQEITVAETEGEAGSIGPATRPSEVQAIGYLSLVTDSEPDAPVVELPVLAGPGLDDRWLRDQPSFVPEALRQGWERYGYDVESTRRLVSVQLDDTGRYLTIPVDEVRLLGTPRVTY